MLSYLRGAQQRRKGELLQRVVVPLWVLWKLLRDSVLLLLLRLLLLLLLDSLPLLLDLLLLLLLPPQVEEEGMRWHRWQLTAALLLHSWQQQQWQVCLQLVWVCH